MLLEMSQSLSLANWMVGLHCHTRSSHFTETSESNDKGFQRTNLGLGRKFDVVILQVNLCKFCTQLTIIGSVLAL